MKKKLLGVLLSLAMALNFTVVSAFAVEKPTITVETAANAVEAGATVALSVSIEGNTGFTNYEWNIQYDKDRLELTTINSEFDIISNTNHSKTGFGYATCARVNSYENDTELFTLTFTVKEDAKAGNAEVKIESDNFKNNDVAIDADYVVGGVTVNGSTGGTTGGSGSTGGTTGGSGSTGGSTGGSGSTGGVAKDNVTVTPATPTVSFTDVPASAYYYDAVKWAAKKGITGGIGSGLFGPEQPCTRAQIVTFLWRAAGSPEPKSAASGMTDVVSGGYYEKAVAWAIENGITTGTTTSTFSPDATCTRAQAVTFLARALKAKAESAAEFSDVPTGSYFADAVAWAAANGVTEGIGGGLFGSDNDCTRGQIVTFLYRAYNK